MKKKKKKAPEAWAPVSQVTQNLEWGVSVGYGERNNVALCASRAEKTNRFPWKEIMFGLHLRRPHKADQSPVCCVQQGEEEEEEERIWTVTLTCAQACRHAHALTHFRAMSDRKKIWNVSYSSARWTQHNTLASNTLWSKDKMCDCAVFFLLTCDNMAIWTASWVGTLLVYRQSNTLVGWQAEGLAGGCCPQEGVALNLAPPYSVKQGVCSWGEERRAKKNKKKTESMRESSEML